ncbi:NUDIX hydrolase [Halobacterium jilantaiense]|uniref:hypothetical protein n=1 Tax=Halobacterium jilantaiense TaxID=355548 RepID=UPI00115FE432|nr:hypothetical protein [Halobacterium jilantaiense]
MTGPDSLVHIDSLSDLESLLDHPDLAVETRTEPIDAADFDAAEAWTDRVVVGVADGRGVLLYDDGHHGWTPPAFEVPDDEDALAVADREFAALTGTHLSISGVLHARRRTFTVADDDRETAVWNVLLWATPDTRIPDDPESEADDADLAWRDAAPDDAPRSSQPTSNASRPRRRLAPTRPSRSPTRPRSPTPRAWTTRRSRTTRTSR